MSCLYVRIPCLEFHPFFMSYLWPIRWHLLLRLLENPQFLLRAIERNGQTLAFVSTDLAMDATFVLMALRPGPGAMDLPSPGLMAGSICWDVGGGYVQMENHLKF